MSYRLPEPVLSYLTYPVLTCLDLTRSITLSLPRWVG